MKSTCSRATCIRSCCRFCPTASAPESSSYGGRFLICPRSSVATLIGMPGLVIGVERLRLKGHEKGSVLATGVFKDQAAILVNAIIARMPFIIALIHVDVMNTVAG